MDATCRLCLQRDQTVQDGSCETCFGRILDHLEFGMASGTITPNMRIRDALQEAARLTVSELDVDERPLCQNAISTKQS